MEHNLQVGESKMNLRAVVSYKGSDLRVGIDDTLPDGTVLIKYPKSGKVQYIKLINIGD